MGQKYTEEYKADVLKLADEIGVGAACQQLGISTKTVERLYFISSLLHRATASNSESVIPVVLLAKIELLKGA